MTIGLNQFRDPLQAYLAENILARFHSPANAGNYPALSAAALPVGILEYSVKERYTMAVLHVE